MRRFTLSLILTLMSFAAVHADSIPATAPNCKIDFPPAASGENANHGILIKVFPRKSQVGGDYNGCQTMWIQKENGWEKLSVMHYAKGQLQAWWSADDKDSSGLLCQFSNGKLSSNSPKNCYAPADLGLSKSFAPGCMETAIRAGAITEKCTASLEH